MLKNRGFRERKDVKKYLKNFLFLRKRGVLCQKIEQIR